MKVYAYQIKETDEGSFEVYQHGEYCASFKSFVAAKYYVLQDPDIKNRVFAGLTLGLFGFVDYSEIQQ